MDNYNDISNFKQLETALIEFINVKDTFEHSQVESQINQMWAKFKYLFDALDVRASQISNNDVLRTRKIVEDSDAIVDECYNRVNCIKLFLKLPLEPDLENTLKKMLSDFTEYADIMKGLVADQRKMLSIMSDPKNLRKKQNSSGCMVVAALFLVSAICLILL